EYGAATQLEKIDMLDFADLVAINKFDKAGALDALRDVRKQIRRNRGDFTTPDAGLGVYGTVASAFADPGTDALYRAVLQALADETDTAWMRPASAPVPVDDVHRPGVLPPERERYLAEIADASEHVDRDDAAQADVARTLYQLWGTLRALGEPIDPDRPLPDPPSTPTGHLTLDTLWERYAELLERLPAAAREDLRGWPSLRARYAAPTYAFEVSGKTIEQPLQPRPLSGLALRRICLPRYHDWGDILAWLRRENVPGTYPFTAGVFPLKRAEEEPTRMFAGEGGPERTNHRFHYL